MAAANPEGKAMAETNIARLQQCRSGRGCKVDRLPTKKRAATVGYPWSVVLFVSRASSSLTLLSTVSTDTSYTSSDGEYGDGGWFGDGCICG